MERLSGLDASFLYLETPAQMMHVCGLVVVDPSTIPGGYSFPTFAAELSERIDLARAILDRFRSSGVLAPLTNEERQRQEKALADLDQYIRDDESIHTSISYLMQIASRLRV